MKIRTAAAVLPFVSGSYMKKGLSLADDAFDLARSGTKNLDEILETESYTNQHSKNAKWIPKILKRN